MVCTRVVCVCVPRYIRVCLSLPSPWVPQVTDRTGKRSRAGGQDEAQYSSSLSPPRLCLSASVQSIQNLKYRGYLQPGARRGCHKLRLHNGSVRWYLPWFASGVDGGNIEEKQDPRPCQSLHSNGQLCGCLGHEGVWVRDQRGHLGSHRD